MVDREKLIAFDTRKYPVRPHVGVGILLVRDKTGFRVRVTRLAGIII